MLNILSGFSLVQKIVGGAALALIVGLFIALKVEQRAHAKANAHIVKLVAAREADRRAYEAAQVKAAELNRNQVKAIETQQQRITANVEADLTSRLERLRSELRSKSAANQGASRGTGAGGVPAAPQGTDGEARLCLTSSELLRGAESEERYDQLITWIEQQLGVRR